MAVSRPAAFPQLQAGDGGMPSVLMAFEALFRVPTRKTREVSKPVRRHLLVGQA